MHRLTIVVNLGGNIFDERHMHWQSQPGQYYFIVFVYLVLIPEYLSYILYFLQPKYELNFSFSLVILLMPLILIISLANWTFAKTHVNG